MSLRNSRKRRQRLRRLLVREYGSTCMRCQRWWADGCGLTLDHVTPLREGGADEVFNLQLLCNRCHRRVDRQESGGDHPEKIDYRPHPWPPRAQLEKP